MKPSQRLGVVLIVCGLAALAYQGITGHEPRERRGHRSFLRDGRLREDDAGSAGVGDRGGRGGVVLLIAGVRKTGVENASRAIA